MSLKFFCLVLAALIFQGQAQYARVPQIYSLAPYLDPFGLTRPGQGLFSLTSIPIGGFPLFIGFGGMQGYRPNGQPGYPNGQGQGQGSGKTGQFPGVGQNPGANAGVQLPGAGQNPGANAGVQLPGAGQNPGANAGVQLPGAGQNPGVNADVQLPDAEKIPGVNEAAQALPGAA